MTTLRDHLNNNKPLAVIALLAIIVGAWWFTLKPAEQPTAGQAYYLDLQTNTLFSAPETAPSPIPAPSGGEGVKANVFTCGECSDEASRFIGFLEKYTEAYKTALTVDQEMPEDIAYNGQLFGTPDGKQWMPRASEEGMAFALSLVTRCDGQPAIPCLP